MKEATSSYFPHYMNNVDWKPSFRKQWGSSYFSGFALSGCDLDKTLC